MTSHDEVLIAAYAELTAQGYLPTSKIDRMAVTEIVVDAVAPLIAADADEQIATIARLSVEVAELRRGLESCRMRAALLRKALDEAQDAEETLDGLRERVEALSRAPLSPLDWVLRADVLALFDGGGSDA